MQSIEKHDKSDSHDDGSRQCDSWEAKSGESSYFLVKCFGTRWACDYPGR